MESFAVAATILGVIVMLCGAAYLIFVAHKEQKRAMKKNNNKQIPD